MAPVFVLLFVLGARAAVLDLANIKAKQNEEYHCEPACGEGECCTHYYAPVHGKRALVNPANLLPQSHWPGVIKRCQPYKQSGEKCLTRNDGEWCPCTSGLTCHADGTTGLDAYFGKCA